MRFKIFYCRTRVYSCWVILCTLFCFEIASAQASNPRLFDAHFKERYASDTYNYEGKEVIRNSKKGSGNYVDFENTKTKVEEENNQKEFTGEIWGTTLLNWIFIIVLALAVVYLVYSIINEGGNRLFTTQKNTAILPQEELTVQNLQQTDIEGLIAFAEKNEDFRLAIRFYHMLVLKKLSLKNFIKLEEDKTNEEYFHEIKQQSFSSDFKFTSYLYDYIWYGEFPINKWQYQKAKDTFTNLLKKVLG
ncbi:MAG: hypothetical protein R2781_05265 [Flavobacteriaceae bacterium]